MKHEGCGGELKRKLKHRQGLYRCQRCRAIVDVGVQVQKPAWSSKLKGTQ